MPRFVLLHHVMPADAGRPDHWDFMLERDDNLATWALESRPDLSEFTSAIRLANHRLRYLDYEGPISGSRGHVTQFDSGEYRLLEENEDLVRAELRGQKLIGLATLVRSEDHGHWQFTYVPD